MTDWNKNGRNTPPRAMRVPAVWPGDEGLKRSPRRWAAGPEPWEVETEPFEAATVLEDLETTTHDPRAAGAVITRYAVLRLVLRAAAGTPGATVAEERAAAAAYLAGDVALGRTERAALDAVLRRAARRPRPGLAPALIDAAGCAAARGHRAGAFALLRTAYRLGLAHGWNAQAGQAAARVADLARAAGARRSERRWRRRATVLERRAAREEGGAGRKDDDGRGAGG